MNKICVFEGSKKDFEKLLLSEEVKKNNYINFMNLVQLYNKRLRQSSDQATGDALLDIIKYDYCIVYADDYGSVLDHVINNFINILSLNTDFREIFLHNPPTKVLESLESRYGHIMEYKKSSYNNVKREELKEIYKKIDCNILGQKKAKRSFATSLLAHTYKENSMPTVLLLYGPSGIGKTETAKLLSKYLGGKLTRIQFSMMQGNSAIEYVFGSEHSRSSLARDLYSRETNIILIDEFDKVNTIFYNAFYELFDEGQFTDSNYNVPLRDTLFILTTNFQNEDSVIESLGMPMFSRIDSCIEYVYLDKDSKLKIMEKEFKNLLEILNSDDKKIINQSNVYQWFEDNIDSFDNVRLLKSKLNMAIFDHLIKEILG